MPQLAAFPKAWMDPLCIDGSMKLEEWIEMAATLQVDGLEMFAGMLDLNLQSASRYRKMSEDNGMAVPMFCCSPDFTSNDANHRQQQIDLEKKWIDIAAALGCQYCRVLSGQRRDDVSLEDGLAYAAESIAACLDHASDRGITLVIENHYKDNYWTQPEFAQKMEVFCALLDRVPDPRLGVNYDPSNTILAGEDPLDLLSRVKHRVVTMHASDRFLISGTLEDLRREETDAMGYAARLSHGEIGQGLNDYDAIFSELKSVGFDSWISIEDGVEGIDQMRRSVAFLREKIAAHW